MKREEVKQALIEILTSPEGKELVAGIVELPTLYTLDQVTERTGISLHTLRQAIKDGDLEAAKTGREYRVSAKDLIKYLVKCKGRAKQP